MRDWTGTRIQAEALAVPCRYCGAQVGEVCMTKDDDHRPLRAFPAHVSRINDGQAVAK